MRLFTFRAASGRPHTIPGRGRRGLRYIDKYAGAPLVFALGMLRRRGSLPSRLRRIGLLNTAAIGDTLLMAGPLADLRERYPFGEFVVLAGPSNYEAAKLLDPEVRVVNLPVLDPLSSVRLLRGLRLDLLLDFGAWARLNALLSALSRAKFTVGFRTRGQYRHYAYDAAVEHSDDLHELENYRRLTAVVNVAPEHQPRIRGQLPSNGGLARSYLVFHLWPGGTASRYKQWPLERWIKLAEHFIRAGFTIVFTGSPPQQSANDAVIAALNPELRGLALNQAGLSLAGTCALISGASLVVSVDTGAMHLAAALEAPTLALMGPACRRRWGPVSDSARVLE